MARILPHPASPAVEALLDLLPFLALLVYAVLRALGARNKAARTSASAPGDAAPDENPNARPQTDFDELARHLESLISGVPVEATPPPPPEPRYKPEFHSSEVNVDESASFQHQAHGFGPANPLSEEMFERQPAFRRTPSPRASLEAFDPHGLKRPIEPPAPSGSRWKKRLADPKRAREAFVLQTILERPQERRR